jgi:hypothetical protein
MKKGYMDSLSSKRIIKDQSLLRHEDIRHNLTILPELQALIPPLLPDELQQLENNIRRDGCREALLVWETTQHVLNSDNNNTPLYILIDGHNRYAICQRNSIDFRVSLRPFENLDEVRTFMIDNQLGRRNLTPEQTAYLRGLRYQQEKGERGQYNRENHKGQNVLYAPDEPVGQPFANAQPKRSTAQRLANQYNVNEKTIKRDAEFAAGIDKLVSQLKADVLSGKVTVKKSLIQELGKQDIPEGSVNSLDELTIDVQTTSIPSLEGGSQIGANSSNNHPALRAKLQELALKLAKPSKKDTVFCNELIVLATQLKSAL